MPELVSSFRMRQLTPFGNMHIHVTVDPRSSRELEVFAQLGKGGDVANSDLEAICRMISLWLRAGGGLRLVIKQLAGIGSSLQIPTRGGRIMSLGDGLACALKKYLRAKERFGLRALLLGEADLAALDRPDDTAGADRPLLAGHGNGGEHPRLDNGGGAQLAALGVAAPATELTPAGRLSGLGNGHAADTDGKHMLAGGGDGSDADSVTALAVLDDVAEIEAVGAADLAVAIDDTGLVDVTGVAGDVYGGGGAKLSGPRDVAAHYKLKCPECEGELTLQEGCKVCYECGWSAC